MTLDHPLRLRPILQEYLWGGRRLGSLLGKPIGDADAYAESWEVVDHPDEDQSIVADGPAGRQDSRFLRSLPVHFPVGAMYGAPTATIAAGGAAGAQFPLLFKFLDAQKHAFRPGTPE